MNGSDGFPCGGQFHVIAFLTDTRVIGRILEALVEWGKEGTLPASVAELATTAE